MSLTVYLMEVKETDVFDASITHNLTRMATEAGIYRALWRPEEIGVTNAAALSPILDRGLRLLRDDPARFRALNPPNGWGNYEGLVDFVERYLRACAEHPGARVVVSR